MLFATHEEVRIAIKVSYIIEYNEPAESNLDSIANDLHARWGIHKKTVKNVFKRMRDGDQNAEKQRKEQVKITNSTKTIRVSLQPLLHSTMAHPQSWQYIYVML
jgi:hypothetical protein